MSRNFRMQAFITFEVMIPGVENFPKDFSNELALIK